MGPRMGGRPVGEGGPCMGPREGDHVRGPGMHSWAENELLFRLGGCFLISFFLMPIKCFLDA